MAAETIKVLYIGGYGRSGSTVLGQLLGQVQGFHSVGEMWNIWRQCFTENQLCGCGKPFRQCDLWRAVVNEAFGGLDQLNLAEITSLSDLMRSPQYFFPVAYPHLRTAAQKQKIETYLAYLTTLYSAIQSVSASQVIVDSSKGPRYAMLLSEIPQIDLRVVHLVRDSRGVVYSWQKKRLKPEVYWKTEYMDRVNPISAAFLWNFTNLFMQSMQKKRAPYLLVRYEDLIDCPRSWLAKIIHLATENQATENQNDQDQYHDNQDPDIQLRENKFEANLLNVFELMNPTADHTAGGNPSRYRQGAITLRPDNEWKQEMPEVQKQLVSVLTAPLLNKYGYSTPAQATHHCEAAVDASTALVENETPVAQG